MHSEEAVLKQEDYHFHECKCVGLNIDRNITELSQTVGGQTHISGTYVDVLHVQRDSGTKLCCTLAPSHGRFKALFNCGADSLLVVKCAAGYLSVCYLVEGFLKVKCTFGFRHSV